MKKLLFFLISFFIGFLILGIVLSKIGFEQVSKAFESFNFFGVFLIIFLTFLAFIIGAFRWSFVLKNLGYHISPKKIFGLYLGGFALSYFSPIALLGGEIFMIYGLKKLFFVPFEKGTTSIFVFKILDALVFFIFLFSGIYIFFFKAEFIPSTKFFLAGAGMAIFLFSLLCFFFLKSSKKESLLEWFLGKFGFNKEKVKNSKGGKFLFKTEKEIFSFFREKKKIVLKTLSFSFLRYSLLFLRVFFLIFFFKKGLDLLNAFSVYGFYNLSSLVPLPALLGSLETFQAGVFSALNLGANTGIAFSLTIRGIDVLFGLVGIFFLLKFGFEILIFKISEFFERISR